MKKKPTTSAPAPAATTAPAAASADPATEACLSLGWAMIAGFLALGIVLESFHLVKLPFYLDVRLRRELWTLAHAHGTLLGILNVLFALCAVRAIPDAGRRSRAARALRVGALLVPLGFFLGGVANAEGDPSPVILLVPAGALLVLYGAAALALGVRSSRR
jgi:hypothetical protein